MSDDFVVETELSLLRLSATYAVAADCRDGKSYANQFVSDGLLSVRHSSKPSDPVTEIRGYDQLIEVPSVLARTYDRTFHFVGQSLYEFDLGRASGTVYCQAHHLSTAQQAHIDYIMYIRYEDRYRWDDGIGWRIATRIAWIDWTETALNRSAGGVA